MLKLYQSLISAFVLLVVATATEAAGNPAKFYLKFRLSPKSSDYYYVRPRTENDKPREDERNVLFATKSETNKYTLAYFYFDDSLSGLMHVPGIENIGFDNSLRLSLKQMTSLEFSKQWNDQAKETWVRLKNRDGSFYTCSTNDEAMTVAVLKPADKADDKYKNCVAFDHFVVVNIQKLWRHA